MALEKCKECGAQVSTEAATCPHCGAPCSTQPRTQSTETTRIKLKKTNGIGGMAFLIGIAGVILIFVLPPVGLLMLMVSGFMHFFGESKVDGLRGSCPHCGTVLTLDATVPGSTCPACAKRFLNKDGKFTTI